MPTTEDTKTYLQVEGTASDDSYIDELRQKAYDDILRRCDISTWGDPPAIPATLRQAFFRIVSHYFHNPQATSLPYIDLSPFRKWKF